MMRMSTARVRWIVIPITRSRRTLDLSPNRASPRCTGRSDDGKCNIARHAGNRGETPAILEETPQLTPEQRSRYARQIRVASISEQGQQRLLDARALIVGLGGLGSPAAMYLAASGVGRLVLNDFDRVEPGNLQRQIAHQESDIGELKAASAKATLQALNAGCSVEAIDWQLDERGLREQTRLADVVLDCSDNFETRFLLNRVAVDERTPLVSAAAIREEGQLLCVLPGGKPCYACLYPEDAGHQESCAMEGVLAPVVGAIGCLQALLAIRILCGDLDPLRGRLTLFDAASMTWQNVSVPARAGCPVCAHADADD
jgi:adenylyltransferase/sulfurtransferase